MIVFGWRITRYGMSPADGRRPFQVGVNPVMKNALLAASLVLVLGCAPACIITFLVDTAPPNRFTL